MLGSRGDLADVKGQRRSGVLKRLSFLKLKIEGTASQVTFPCKGRTRRAGGCKRPVREVRQMATRESHSIPGEEKTNREGLLATVLHHRQHGELRDLAPVSPRAPDDRISAERPSF